MEYFKQSTCLASFTRRGCLLWIAVGFVSFSVGCTTLNSRNAQIMDEYGKIEWQNGIDEKEALVIVKHYMHIQNSHHGVRYLYPEVPTDAGERWVFGTTFRNSNYERDPEQRLTLLIDKKSGEVSAELPQNSRRNEDSIENILSRFEKVNRKDGIDRGEAVDIMKHHYYIEAKNQYWMYDVNFIPTESKRFWIFELQVNPNASMSDQQQAKKIKKTEGLYLVVNKLNGELFKERSYRALIQ